jgi:hypothetical protein
LWADDGGDFRTGVWTSNRWGTKVRESGGSFDRSLQSWSIRKKKKKKLGEREFEQKTVFNQSFWAYCIFVSLKYQ